MSKCKMCSKDLTGISYGSGKFCSPHCARKYSSSKVTSRGHAIQKATLIEHRPCNGDNIITRSCSICGAKFKSNKYSMCYNCRLNLELTDKEYRYDYVRCPYCGHPFKNVTNHHLLSQHGKTVKNLVDDYGSDYPRICSTLSSFRSKNLIHKYNMSHPDPQSLGKVTRVHSVKNSKDYYLRSSWELIIYNQLESSTYDYSYEGLKIPYFNATRGRMSIYLPDFYLRSLNLILEVKPKYAMNNATVRAKERAARSKGYNYRFVTEDDLGKNLKSILLI